MNNLFPVIDVANLHYRYHDGTEALQGVTLCIDQGETVCLAGPNGAGKSTLLLCLAGLLKAEGQINIGEGGNPVQTDVAPLDPAFFGLVFQYPDDQLFCPTVAEDVAFGPCNQKKPEDEIKLRVKQALSAVELIGYEARSTHHLSGGEKKRAAIAAVLACQPKILAFDEPWANLDARASRAVTAIMSKFGGTLIVASHNLSRAAEVCARLVIIDRGIIIADGPMKDLVTNTTLLEDHGLEL